MSAGYKVRVIDLESESTDESNDVFTIDPAEDPTPCVLTVTGPNGGETWVEGLSYPITWTASDCGAEVMIELLRDGSPAAVIATSTANDGSYSWTAAQADGELAGYSIRITDLESASADASNGTFSIGDAPPNPDNYFCVSTTGTKTSGISTTDIANFGWANSDCYHSIGAAINAMSPGDQVWINDGTYYEDISLHSSESGSANNYTIIRARNAGKVALEGDNFAMIDLRAASYIEIDGLRILRTGAAAIYVHEASHHFKILRTGWNQRAGLISDDSHHGLMEDCYAWGGPHRYAFQVNQGANHIVFRRCRRALGLLQRLGATGLLRLLYLRQHLLPELHHRRRHGQQGCRSHLRRPQELLHAQRLARIAITSGCISLNMDGAAGWWLEGPTAEGSLTDCVAWDHRTNAGDATDTYKPYTFSSTADYGGWLLNRCTFGINDLGSRPVSFDQSNAESMVNSIIYGMTLNEGQYAVSANLDEHDYNCYWGNTGGRNQASRSRSALARGHQPDHGRPEFAGRDRARQHALERPATNGGRIGAHDREQDRRQRHSLRRAGLGPGHGREPLALSLRGSDPRGLSADSAMSAGAAYSGSPAMNGARGFCAPGQSLTNHILNYLDR